VVRPRAAALRGRCSERTPMHQLPTGCSPGEAEASTAHVKTLRARDRKQSNQFVPYPNLTGVATHLAGDCQITKLVVDGA
jgi:hypothetical protein